MRSPATIKYWWSEDRKWFCILVDDGNNKATVSLTPEEASLLSMNAVLDEMVECPSCKAWRDECRLCGGSGKVTEQQFRDFGTEL